MTRPAAVLVLLAAAAGAAAAQDTVVVVSPRGTSRVAREALTIFNAARTTRVYGRLTIGPDDEYPGDIAVLDGPVRISGVVRGDLVAINATVTLTDGADIRGDVLVIGGSVASRRGAYVRGTVRAYRDHLTVRRVRDRIELVGERAPPEPRRRWSRRWNRNGRASIILATGGTYNRVEGLAVLVGPKLEWQGDVGGRIEAVGVFRTAGDFNANREDIGYAVDASLRVGSWEPIVRLGARAYDVVRPVEDWQLHRDEIGFGTLLFHRDYRDYYLQRGFGAYLEITPVRDLTLSGSVSLDEEASVGARDPWTLFRGSEVWRANPRIDAGDFLHVRAGLEWDGRAGRTRGTGWYVQALWERGIVQDDFVPRPLPLGVRAPPSLDDYTYDRVFLDLRRYDRIGWSGQLRLRAVAAGAVGTEGLPVQRRLSLGGPDPLPGFPFRRFACNAAASDASQPALCDRLVLFQAEYRGDLFFGLFDYFDHRAGPRRATRRERGWADRWDWDDWFWFDGPDLVLFGNAGTTWLRDDDPNDLEFDVGAGITFGSLGVYGAKALTRGEPLRVFVRLHHRF